MIEIKDLKVTSTKGKYVHRIGTTTYGKSMTVLADETADNFEEVDEMPATDAGEEEPRALRIEQLIRKRYSVSDELAILRQRDTKPEEFAAYFDFVEQCKREVADADGI